MSSKTEVEEETQPTKINETSSTARRLTTSTPVQLTLLLLYSFPLLAISLAALTSQGFSVESKFVVVVFEIAIQYVASLRESLATFVIPFVTAFASAERSEKRSSGLKSLTLFFIFVFLLVLAIFMSAYIGVQEKTFLQNINIEPEKAPDLFLKGTTLLKTYTKEILTYLSLLLGISIWGKK